MKFYISSLFAEKDRVRQIYKKLEAQRHEITVDWTLHDGVSLEERDEKADVVCKYAEKDVNGVIERDVFVILTEPLGGRTQYAELGVAIMFNLTFGKPQIYAVGEEVNQVTFYYHLTVKRLESIDEVLDDVERLT